MLDDGRVVVCDRENFRVQVFTEDGVYIEQLHLHRPQAICVGRGDDQSIYVTETRPPTVQQGVPGLGLRIRVLDRSFNEITSFGAGTSGEDPGQFISPHGIAVDSEGSVYIAEIPLPPASRPQTPQVTELLRLVLPLSAQVKPTFLSIKPGMTGLALLAASAGGAVSRSLNTRVECQ